MKRILSSLFSLALVLFLARPSLAVEAKPSITIVGGAGYTLTDEGGAGAGDTSLDCVGDAVACTSAAPAGTITVTTTAKQFSFPCRNESGGNFAANDLVAISSWTEANTRKIISLADADAVRPAKAVLTAAVNNNANGTCYLAARSAASLDTSACAAVGSPVYLTATGTTTNTWTCTDPSDAGVRTQIVGHVAVKDAAVGVIEWDLLDNAPFKAIGSTDINTDAVTADKMATSSVDLATNTITGALPVTNGGVGGVATVEAGDKTLTDVYCFGQVIFSADAKAATLPTTPHDGCQIGVATAGPGWTAIVKPGGADTITGAIDGSGWAHLGYAHGYGTQFRYIAALTTWVILPQPVGEWNTNVYYTIGQIASDGTNYYIAMQNNNGHTPSGNDAFWHRLDAPDSTTAEYSLDSDVAANGSLAEHVFFRAKSSTVLTTCKYVPDQAMGAASDADYVTVTITRYDADGTNGVVVIAATSQATGGVLGAAAQFDETDLGTLANTTLTAGKILTIQVGQTNNGLALQSGFFVCNGTAQ